MSDLGIRCNQCEELIPTAGKTMWEAISDHNEEHHDDSETGDDSE